MQMTFLEFMIGYKDYFTKRGEAWLGEYMDDLLERSVSSYELISNEMQELTRVMWLNGPREIAEYGYAWSKRDRLGYMMEDWNRYSVTGENYF